MKISIKHLQHTPSNSLTARIEQHLNELGKLRQIDEARITVEHRPEASPPFRISAHLVTPGPDFTAEAFEHTLRAALQRVVDQLSAAIEQRQIKRARTTVKTAPVSQMNGASRHD